MTAAKGVQNDTVGIQPSSETPPTKLDNFPPLTMENSRRMVPKSDAAKLKLPSGVQRWLRLMNAGMDRKRGSKSYSTIHGHEK